MTKNDEQNRLLKEATNCVSLAKFVPYKIIDTC